MLLHKHVCAFLAIRSFICYTTLTSFDDKGRASYGNVKSCITPITAKQAVTAAHCVPVNEKIGFLFETMDLDGVVRTVRLMHICRKNDFAFLENLGPDFNYGRPLAELSVGTEYFCAVIIFKNAALNIYCFRASGEPAFHQPNLMIFLW